MIVCGWCGAPTPLGACASCGRDAALPWAQRAMTAPVADPYDTIRKRLAGTVSDIEATGQRATAERIAEQLDVSPRTVRRWQQMTAL